MVSRLFRIHIKLSMKNQIKHAGLFLLLLTAISFIGCSKDSDEIDLSGKDIERLDGGWKLVREKKVATDISGNETIMWDEIYDYDDEDEFDDMIINTSLKKVIHNGAKPEQYIYDEVNGIFTVISNNSSGSFDQYRVLLLSKDSLKTERFYKLAHSADSNSIYRTYTRISNVEELYGQTIDWGEPDPNDVTVVQQNIKNYRYMLAKWTNDINNCPNFSLYSDGTSDYGQWSYSPESGILAFTNGMTFTVKSWTEDMLIAEYSSGSGTYTWGPTYYDQTNMDFENYLCQGKWRRNRDGSILTINGTNFTFEDATNNNIITGVYACNFNVQWNYSYPSYPCECWIYNGEQHILSSRDCIGSKLRISDTEYNVYYRRLVDSNCPFSGEYTYSK